MLDPRQVEAALERFMDQADEVSDEYEPVVVLAAAARAWLAEGDATPEAGSLSTPTEPTDEQVEAGLEVYNRYRNNSPLFDDARDFILQVLRASRAEETP